MKTSLRLTALCVLVWLLLAACAVPPADRPSTPPAATAGASAGTPGAAPAAATAQPAAAPANAADAAPSAEGGLPTGATPDPATAVAVRDLPPGVAAALGARSVAVSAEADLLVQPVDGAPVGVWVYAPVGPFATLEDGVSTAELRARWSADGPPLLVDEAGLAAFTRLWGAPGSAVVETAADAIPQQLWQRAGGAWALVPFEALRPDLKVLTVDGQTPLRGDLNTATYPLAVPLGLTDRSGAPAAWPASAVTAATAESLTNWRPDHMARVAMTGVTALVRATAFAMEQNGILYPGEEVRGVLRAADLAHISNEVAFVADCPYPNPVGGTTFCSADRYFDLLLDLGIDVVELTGNHVNDYGPDNLARSIDRYAEAGMNWFGGGRDAADAQTAALYEINGNRIAFVGCNPFGPPYAWATATQAGSRPCDDLLYAQIAKLRAAGTVVIATLQYNEYYQYPAPPDQQAAFRALAEAGAAFVSGSQGHHAQGFGFHNGALIHYGLGNLFFDQMDWLGTRQTFVDQLTIYDGRLVGVELWTGLIENYARPRLMTPQERRDLLETVFANSDW